MAITLTVTSGPHVGRTFTFTEHDTFTVGRAANTQLSLPDDRYFSRYHFMVEVNPPLCRLVDLHSHNGTLVNGLSVRHKDLVDGDEIRAGTTSLQVRLDAEPAHEQTVSLPAASPATVSLVPAGDWPRFPGYRVEGELGRGGMGVVYKAVRAADGGLVALKTIKPAARPDQLTLGRFSREIAILRQLDHKHIVALRDHGEADGVLWFAMDLIDGIDAGKLVKAHGPLPVPRAARLVVQLLDALAYAHGLGFVHRDVKPGNLLVQGAGPGEAARLADFGLARTYQASKLSGLTSVGGVGGTPAFMPPEQVLNFRGTKPPADQYGAAATLYYLLCGQPVYAGTTNAADLFVKLLREEPVPLATQRADVPGGLAAAIHKALARNPEDRYLDVHAFAKALAPYAKG